MVLLVLPSKLDHFAAQHVDVGVVQYTDGHPAVFNGGTRTGQVNFIILATPVHHIPEENHRHQFFFFCDVLC